MNPEDGVFLDIMEFIWRFRGNDTSSLGLMMLQKTKTENFECSVVRVPRGAYPATMEEELNNDLFSKFLALRTEIFTNQKGWKVWLPTRNDLDQYDQFDARYIVAHNPENGDVLGGARLLKTSRNKGNESEDFRPTYMIKDAYHGVLDGIPPTICEHEPPADDEVWELTRLVATGGAAVSKSILLSANHYIAMKGGKRCLFLGPPAFLKMAKGMGFTPVPLGAITGNRDGRFLAFETEVIPISDTTEKIVDLGRFRRERL